MKKIYTLLILAAICFQINLLAQEPRIVKIPGWDPTSGPNTAYVDAVLKAVNDDAALRETSPNVIYELERGKLYPFASRISPNFDFHIRAEAGDGAKPIIINEATSTGAYLDFFRSQKNFTMENIHVEGYTPDGGVTNRSVQFRGEGSRVIIKGCIFDGDRGAALSIWVDDIKLYITDVVAGNQGHRKTVGGNGRLLDIRAPNTVDSLVIKNTTTYHFSDRIVRNMSPIINYFEADHLTAFNIIGLHGGLQIGKAKNAIVTNSVFANNVLVGDNPFNVEQTQPEKSFFVITLDTIYAGGTYEIRNNNIYWDQEVLDVWAQIDSVNIPGLVNPTMLAAAATTLENATFSERLSFANVCAPPTAFIAAMYANPAASEFPENWCVGGDGGIFADEIDVAYSNTSVSYKAADMGYPVGDLNFFPERKALWAEGVDLTVSVNDVAEIQSILAYPNPVKNVLYLSMEADQIAVYNVLGKEVLNAQNAQSINMSELSEGMYMVRIIKDNRISTQKIMVNR